MTKVLFLAYHFPPIGGAGVQRNLKFARYLPELDYEPIVVTGPGPSDDRWTPIDASLGGEVPAKVSVHRLSDSLKPSGRWRSRAERWLAVETAWSRWWTQEAVEAGLDLGRDVGVVYASLVPYESAWAALRIARSLGKPLVVDLQDPWALDEMWVYPTAAHRALDRRRMRRCLAAADAIVMNTPESRMRVLEQFPELRPEAVFSIPNGFDAADFADPAPLDRHDGTFRIVHTGYLHTDLGRSQRRTAGVKRLLGGAMNGVDILTRSHVYLLEALDSLIQEEPELESVLELHLAGVLSPTDREIAGDRSVVRMRGYLSHRDTVALMRSADLLFLPMHKLPHGYPAGIVPGKTYEYLASGRPILAAVPEGDARQLVREGGTGLVCNPDDIAGMAAIIRRQLERWRSGQPSGPRDQAVLARYERRALTRQLASVFDALCAGAAPERSAERRKVAA
jgi:glycosyltransferase involved in cell wall biosynthesis